MNVSEDPNNEKSLPANSESLEVKKPEFKKYVFKIDSKYIDYIEHMDHKVRNSLINQLISDHIIYEQNFNEYKKTQNKVKNIVIIVLLIVIGLPLLIYFINISIDATQSSYNDMQMKFQTLYKNSGKY